MNSLKQIVINLRELDKQKLEFLRVKQVQEAFGCKRWLAVLQLELCERFGYLKHRYLVNCANLISITSYDYRFQIEKDHSKCLDCHHKIEKVYVYL